MKVNINEHCKRPVPSISRVLEPSVFRVYRHRKYMTSTYWLRDNYWRNYVRRLVMTSKWPHLLKRSKSLRPLKAHLFMFRNYILSIPKSTGIRIPKLYWLVSFDQYIFFWELKVHVPLNYTSKKHVSFWEPMFIFSIIFDVQSLSRLLHDFSLEMIYSILKMNAAVKRTT